MSEASVFPSTRTEIKNLEALPPLTNKSYELVGGYKELLNILPESESNRLGVVIPARHASHFMAQNLPLLESQIEECVEMGKIEGGDVVVVLNRGGTDNDRNFVNNFVPAKMSKHIVWEKDGKLYDNASFENEIKLSEEGKGINSITFIIQEDSDKNTGHSNALRTGFNAFVDEAKDIGSVKKYYLTTDTDNRLHTDQNLNEYTGNGLLGLIEILEKENCFSVGAKVEPSVSDYEGRFHPNKKVSGLVRATANLHSKTKGFQWSPGGGTLARGRDALAGHTAINDRDMEVPDVSFTILSRIILGKKVIVTDKVFVVDDAPEQESLTASELRNLKIMFSEWSRKGLPLSDIVSNPVIPSGWKKLTRWIQGQKFAEDFFGKEIMKSVAQPKIINIVVGNLQATLEKYGYSTVTISEIAMLVKQLPGYLTIKKSVENHSSRVKNSVSW